MFFVLVLFFTAHATPVFAQFSKEDIKLTNYLDQGEFEKIIHYKANKTNKLGAYVLYLKGLAYYLTRNNQLAAGYFGMAIEKGPASDEMFYYHGISLMLSNKYAEALPSLKKATQLIGTDPDYLVSLAQCYYNLGKSDSSLKYLEKAVLLPDYPKQADFLLAYAYIDRHDTTNAVKVFKKKIKEYLPGGPEYGECSYNIALFEYLAGNFGPATKQFEDHVQYYPTDYASVAKLIQCYYAIEQPEKAAPWKDTLRQAQTSHKMPIHMQNMYCFDQFVLNNVRYTVFEYFEENSNEDEPARIAFFHNKKTGDEHIDLKIFAQRDTTYNNMYVLKMHKDNTLYEFGSQQFKLDNDDDYFKVKAYVMQILNESVEPTNRIENYKDYLERKRLIRLGNSR